MYSVYVVSKRDSRDADLVNLDLVIYRTGYNRATRHLLITGPYSQWNKKTRSFEPCSVDNISKNRLIQQERIRYLKLAEQWEYSGKDWEPKELAAYYDANNDPVNRNATVSQIFDLLIEEYASRKRYRNGKLFTSERAAASIGYYKRFFERFTLARYNKDFLRYRFKDIDRNFLLDFLYHELERGSQNGNRASVNHKLQRLRQTFVWAKELGVYSVNIAVFDAVEPYLKPQRTFSKAVSHDTMMRIEQMDRSGLLKREKLYSSLSSRNQANSAFR